MRNIALPITLVIVAAVCCHVVLADGEKQMTCQQCMYLASAIQGGLQAGLPDANIVELVKAQMTPLPGLSEPVASYPKLYAAPFVEVVRGYFTAGRSATEYCTAVEFCPSGLVLPARFTNMSFSVQTVISRSNCTSSSAPLPPLLPVRASIVQLSDVHLDHLYTVGAATDCPDYSCCHSFMPGNGSASPIGSYHCSSSELMINETLKRLAREHAGAAAVVVTGDMMSAAFYMLKQADTQSTFHRFFELVKAHAPRFLHRILPVIGNHELYPGSLMALDSAKSNWLFNGIATETPVLQKDMAARRTFLQGGYYAHDVRIEPFHFPSKFSAQQRAVVRVIGLNSALFASSDNYYVSAFNVTDPLGQLAWLEQQLARARLQKQQVILLSHHPLNDQILKPYAERLLELLTTYKDVVLMTLTGHLHADLPMVIRDVQSDKEPVAMSFLGPSLSSIDHRDPAYRVYDLGWYQQSLFEVRAALVNYRDHLVDLTKAIQDNAVVFKPRSSFLTRFTPDQDRITPTSLQCMWQKATQDGQLMVHLVQSWFQTVNLPSANDDSVASMRVPLWCAGTSSTIDRKRACEASSSVSDVAWSTA